MNTADLVKENAQLKNQIKENAIGYIKDLDKFIKQIKALKQDAREFLGGDDTKEV